MKKFILVFTALSFFLFSCTSNESKIFKSIEIEVKNSLNDPSSYEFVEAKIIRTISIGERKKTMTLEQLNKIKELNNELPSPELLYQVETEYAFLSNETDETKDAVYYVDFTFRANNAMGGKIKETYSATVINDKTYTVVMLK